MVNLEKTGKRWTPEEDKTLIDQIERHATVLEGARVAQNILGRTVYACTSRYYLLKQKGNDKLYLESDIAATTEAPKQLTWWQKIFNFFSK